MRGAQPPDEAAASRLGFGKHLALLQQLTEPPSLNVFPDNQIPLAIFRRMQFAWRALMGPDGALHFLGMDWSTLHRYELAYGLDDAQRIDLFQCLEMLEAAWLQEMHAYQSEQRKARGS